jgi:hypothetical protein
LTLIFTGRRLIDIDTKTLATVTRLFSEGTALLLLTGY